MNYLHARYHKAGKIPDIDMLYTLGSAVVDVLRYVDRYEWRGLSAVEKCAIGVFQKALGEKMEIPFTALPGSGSKGNGGMGCSLRMRFMSRRCGMGGRLRRVRSRTGLMEDG